MDSRSESTDELHAIGIAKRTSIAECRLLTLAGVGIATSLSGIPFICSSGDQTSFAIGLTLFCLGLLILMGMCFKGIISSLRNGNDREDDVEDDRENLTREENTRLEVLHSAYVCVPTTAPDLNSIETNEVQSYYASRVGIYEDGHSLSEEEEVAPYHHEEAARGDGQYVLLTDITDQNETNYSSYEQGFCSDL